MASTYTSNTGIELIATGEQSGTWGDTTNVNLQIIDRLTNGVGAINLSGTTHTLTTSDGLLSDGHYQVLVFGGSPSGTNTVTISPNDQQKFFAVRNESGESVVLTQGSGGNITVANGNSALVYADGAGAGAAVVNLTARANLGLAIGSDVFAYDANLQGFVNTFALPTTDGSNGQVLTTDGSGNLSLQDVGGGVAGPASSTDNGVVLFDGTTGELLQDSASQDGFIHGIRVGRGNNGVSKNVVLGSGASASSITSASSCVIIGHDAARDVTTGNANIAIGEDALDQITTGSANTAVGYAAMNSGGAGASQNVALGYAALGDVTGDGNVATGYAAALNVTSGGDNSCIGNLAGSQITTGSNNLCLGYAAGRSSSPFNITTQSDRIVLGDSSITNAYIQVAWTVTSDARDKTDVAPITHGLDFIDQLNPVTFKWDKRSNYWVTDDEGNVVERPDPDGTHKEAQPFAGFLAQEVQQAIDATGFPDDVIIDKEQDDLLKIKETALIPVLVKAVQELKARVEALEAGV